MFDIYAKVGELITYLEKHEMTEWAKRFQNSLEEGSTGTEIVMAIKWNSEEFLKSNYGLSQELRGKVIAIYNEAQQALKLDK